MGRVGSEVGRLGSIEEGTSYRWSGDGRSYREKEERRRGTRD